MKIISIDIWIDKENVVYRYNSTQLNKWESVICNHMDDSGGCYAKQNKPCTKEQILHDSTDMRCLK